MNAKAIIIGIVTLLVVGGGVFVATKNNDGAKTANSNSQNSKTSSSLNGLLGQNKNVKCSFNYTDENGNKSSGTAYIAGQRMSGNFTVQPAGQAEQESNLLRDDSYQYVWADGANTGFKTSISAIESADGEESQQSVDQDKKYDFDCSDWSVDESKFRVPSNVEFTDFSAQVQQSQDAQQTINAACAQIQDAAARAACEQAL